MDNRHKHLETLSEIRSLMERSSRFISLSGLSGVAAGSFALLGAAAIFYYFDLLPFDGRRYYAATTQSLPFGLSPLGFLVFDAVAVMVLALTGGIFFTTRKARRKGQTIWNKTSLRLLFNMAIPLVAGGIFCLGLMYHHQFGLVAPATLVFYGLACINGSKYTLDDIRYLGITEVLLGLLAMFYIGYGLEFWAIGFGVMHILYGTYMYYKYEREG